MSAESFIGILVKSIMSGVLVGIGAIVYLLSDNKYLGAFLFSLGLFTIIQFDFSLFTGKVGYTPENKPAYIGDLLITLLGNICGTAAVAAAIMPTHIWNSVHEKSEIIINAKTSDSLIGQLILGLFCGLLMYIAIENNRMCRKKGYDISALFGIVTPVMVFIICGFNHSVADCFYIFAASPSPKHIIYIFTVAIGNAIGAMIIPCVKKLYPHS